MLQICLNLPRQKFVDPLFKKEILAFIRELGYPRNIKSLSDVKVEILPQPWRTFGTIINKCLSAMKESKAYKTYYGLAIGKVTPKPKCNEGTGVSPGVPNVPTYGSEDKQISWKSNDDEVSLSKYDDDDAENDDGHDDDNEQTESDNDGDDFIHPKFSTHVQQQGSSVSSGFISNMLNLTSDADIDSILNLNTESTSLVDVPVTTNDEIPPSSVTTLPPPPIPLIHPLQQTPVFTQIIALSTSLQNLPTFGSLFKFKDRVKALEDDFLEFKQTKLFVEAVSSILGIIDTYLANKMNEANIKEHVKVQVKEQVSKTLPRIEMLVNEQLEAEVMTRSSNKAKTSHDVATNLSKLVLNKILIDKMESNKSIHLSVHQKTLYKALIDTYETDKVILETYGDIVTFKRRRYDEDEDEEPSTRSNRGTLAQKEDPHKSFNELMETLLDFSAFVLNRLNVDTLTPELLAGLTFKLMKGSCKSLVELEYFLKEFCKATTDKLDWNNPKGNQYPHDMRKPLPLIPNSRGRRVIPFDHFINNDLVYLRVVSQAKLMQL
nr:hypothetical protein [Tanacetum cinerariifolium]